MKLFKVKISLCSLSLHLFLDAANNAIIIRKFLEAKRGVSYLMIEIFAFN